MPAETPATVAVSVALPSVAIDQPGVADPLPDDPAKLNIPKGDFPKVVANEYRERLEAHVDELSNLLDERWARIRPRIEALNARRGDARMDDEVDQTERELGELEAAMLALLPAARRREMARRPIDKVRAQVDERIRSIFAELGVNPFEQPIDSRGMESTIKARVRENVRLIRSIPTQYHDEIERIILDGMANGRSVDDIADELQKATGKARNRAKLIARDQVGKAQAEITKQRFADIGIQRGIWRTQLDNRVRPAHIVREGRVFDMQNGIQGEFPGTPINCFLDSTTLIDTEGGQKYIVDIEVGDQVWTHNERYRPVVDTGIGRWYEGLSVTIETDMATVEVTPNHPFLVPINRDGWSGKCESWIPARWIEIGDYIMATRFPPAKVLRIATQIRADYISNFAVQEDESYIANGLVSHNCRCFTQPLAEDVLNVARAFRG